MDITVSGKEYQIATNLRVPFEMQKEFGNKPYTTIFEGLRTSNLEDQIRIIYVAFRILNPNVFTSREFLDIILDTWDLGEVLTILNDLMESITGKIADTGEKKVPLE